MSDNVYEHFRTILTMNLCQVLPAEQLNAAIQAVDITMDDFEIVKKQMEIITTDGVPEVVKHYIASKYIAHCSTGTLKQYRFHLTHFFDAVRKSYLDVTANDIRMYLYKTKTERNTSDHYLDTIRIVLSGFFRWLVDNDYILKSPCIKVEKIHYNRKHMEALSPVQLEEFRWSTDNIREKAMIDFLFSSGCRAAECAAVKLSDIDWQNRSVLIRHGKGDKQRTVFFNAEAYVSLRSYLSIRSDDTDALFVSSRNPHGPITVRTIESIIRKAAKRAGLHVYPHKLRHTFATAGLNSGMPVHILQQLMGHANPETTMIYAKQMQDGLQHEHRRVYA